MADLKDPLYHMQVIDALEAGSVRMFLCTDGKTIGASIQAEIKQESTLCSICGYGLKANTAIAALFRQLTEVKSGEYIVVDAGTEKRRAVKWNGSFWKSQYEPERAAA